MPVMPKTPRYTEGGWISPLTGRKLLRQRREIFPPAKAGDNDVTRFEFLGPRLDDLADGAAIERFAQLKRQRIRFPLVHAPAHVGIHRHKEIAHQHLLILQRLQFGLGQNEVGGGGNSVGPGGQADFPAS